MRKLPLSSLAAIIQESVEMVFGEQTFWVIAETADVKQYPQKRWCFLKLLEKNGSETVCEMNANIWPNGYNKLLRFEKITGQPFKSGIQVACEVKVIFHVRYGIRLEVIGIDAAYTMGMQEMERQETLDRLLRDFPATIKFIDGVYETFNKKLQPALVWHRIALIAAPNSDGYRDFRKELDHNAPGFAFDITDYPVQVQGAESAGQIAAALEKIYPIAGDYDVVAIVRGGGSDTDFAAFDNYSVARLIASFPIPVLTGIGHDRNTSIADLMGWQQKTPTKVATVILDTAIRFANDLLDLGERLDTHVQVTMSGYRSDLQDMQKLMGWIIPGRLAQRRQQLQYHRDLLYSRASSQVKDSLQDIRKIAKQLDTLPALQLKQAFQHLKQQSAIVTQLSPDTILNRGFAMVMQDEQVITDVNNLEMNKPLTTILRNKRITSTIQTIER